MRNMALNNILVIKAIMYNRKMIIGDHIRKFYHPPISIFQITRNLL